MINGIPFTKMSGVGNDFIVIDNRAGVLDGIDVREFARRVCRPRVSLGGDELILMQAPTAGGDFSMRTINPDGQEVKMCGNASRCVARYAYCGGIAGPRMTIDTLGGPVHATVAGDTARVQLQLTTPIAMDHRLTAAGNDYDVHTVEVSGAPHAVVYLNDAATVPGDTIHRLGAAICHHPDFPEGLNVNFVQVIDQHTLWQRTFERGVEGETLACGTGAVASTTISARRGLLSSPVRIHVLGGELDVSFTRQGGEFAELWLGGGVRFVAEGTLHPEAWT